MLLHAYYTIILCKYNLYVYWETKKFVQLILWQYLVYCNGLERNPHYLQSMPILNNLIKRQGLSDWIKKQDSTIHFLQETNFKHKDK